MPNDRRTWLYDERHRVNGFGFRVRSDIPDAPVALGRLLAPMRIAANGRHDAEYSLAVEAGEPPYALYIGDRLEQRSGSGGWMLDWVMSEVTERSLFESRAALAVHAGAVSRLGTCVVMPATAGSGKSTLTCGLVMGGFDLLSDEAALLDPDTGTVSPFPRPVALEPPSLDVLPGLLDRLPEAYRAFSSAGRIFLTAEDLRPGSSGGPSTLTHVVVPRYVPGSETRLEPLTRAQALVEMTTACFNRLSFGGRTVEILGGLLHDATCYRLTSGDLVSAVRVISDMVSRES